ncbi:MAG: Crp/Fnr family transcriptional regulator [Brevundimonas sp.]|nr:MAG: Crp/Fnr family transcriptional regulator [Brevundimonas sp.]
MIDPHSAPNPLQLLVVKLQLRGALTESDKAAILALAHRRKTYESSSYLIWEGDKPSQCDLLLTGFAYRQKQTREGRRQIVSLHMPGEALDFQNLFLDVADHSVQMLTRGEVAVIEREDLQTLMWSYPNVGRAMVATILVEASILREWVLNVGRRDALTRMAHLLCEFAVRLDGLGLTREQGYTLPITQEQFADALGLTPVHVNRTLKALEGLGLITRSKKVIAFPSWRRLQEVADFNPRYLHIPHIA